MHGGKAYKSKSKGEQPNQITGKIGCPFMLKIRATKDGQALEITKFIQKHNHEITELEKFHPSVRKVDKETEKEIASHLQLNASRKLVQQMYKERTGKNILLKDVHNIATRAKENSQKDVNRTASEVESLYQWFQDKYPSMDCEFVVGDNSTSLSEHIKRTCKACFLQMRDLCRIRKYLTSEVAVLAANALVSSRLDYCNSLFRGLSGFNQHKLQSIQNTLARIVTNHRKYAHVTAILQKLHWLPVKYRCIFKTATLVYKFLHSGSPSYFELFLSSSSCPYSTRHSHPDRQYLTVPPFHSSVFKSAKHFGHSFAFDAPKIWNDLPQDVRSATSVASFRKKLKTYPFAKAYPP